MHESNILVPYNLDLVDRPKLAAHIPELLLVHRFGKVANEYVSCGLVLRHSHGNGGRDIGRFAPTNLEFLSVQCELFD